MPINHENLITDENGKLIRLFVDSLTLATEVHIGADIFTLRLYDSSVYPATEPGVQVRMSPVTARRLTENLQSVLPNYGPDGFPLR